MLLRTLTFKPTHWGSLVAALTAIVLLGSGPLDPPVGPVTPTAKPLAEIQPRTAINTTNTPGDADSLFKITAPGSYYLTANLYGAIGKHGIEVASSGVTIDLNGFELLGVAGSLDGITTSVANYANIAVSNGSVRGWGGSGIDLLTNVVFNSRLSDIRAGNNLASGLAIGTACIVTGCSASNNLGNGINTGAAATVTGCTAYGNGINGINLNSACIAKDCTSYFNVASGINAGTGCTVSDCNTRINTGDGIRCFAACDVRNNTCSNNGFNGSGAGVHATGTDNHIDGNTCTNADVGVDVDTSGNLIVRNRCTGNTSNWTIVSGNAIGPIVTAGTTSASINGNGAAPSTLTTTDPFANFNY